MGTVQIFVGYDGPDKHVTNIKYRVNGKYHFVSTIWMNTKTCLLFQTLNKVDVKVAVLARTWVAG